MASGYIAGGAIAGILIAFIAGVPSMAGFNARIEAFGEANPMRSGPAADVLSHETNLNKCPAYPIR
jgi:hypothetical protein